VAQGLYHLYHGCNTPVVHHKLTSNNIFLDQELNVKIPDFGVAGPNQPMLIAEILVGNFGY
jgi:serine/threonine protein kinase